MTIVRLEQFLEAVQASRARVESEVDEEHPNRTLYVITGKTRFSVQVEIDRLRDQVDVFGGCQGRALFMGPIKQDGEWLAVGEVVKDNSLTSTQCSTEEKS